MSNNIYDILKKMQSLEAPKSSATLTESAKKCKTCGMVKCKCDDTAHKAEKKDKKDKGAIAEAVARVEKQLAEKYMGFKKTAAAVAKGGSAKDPEAVAASIGRKKYGKEKFQKAAAAGKKLGEEGVDENLIPVPNPSGASSVDDAKRLGAMMPQPAEKPKNEDMLSPKQKKFAALAEPKDKITYADKIAGAKKGKKTEGNKFSGNLMKARAKGLKKADLDGDGDMEPVHEGWDEMMKAAKERSGPQPRGGSGIKQGTRYGGGRQTDEPDTDNETGEVAKKGRGRPKKDKFAK